MSLEETMQALMEQMRAYMAQQRNGKNMHGYTPLEMNNLNRFGVPVSPIWKIGDEETAPAQDTALVTWHVSAHKVGYFFGYTLAVPEAQVFHIHWTNEGKTKTLRHDASARSTSNVQQTHPFNVGYPADPGTDIIVENTAAGTATKVYQARILVAEVPQTFRL